MKPLLLLLLLALSPVEGLALSPVEGLDLLQQRKIEWKLAPGRVAGYAFLEKNGKPSKDRRLLVFGSELTSAGNRFLAARAEEIPLALLFQLPPESFKSSAAWESTVYFFEDAAGAAGLLEAAVGGGGLRPLCARGRYVLKSIKKQGDDEVAILDSAFTFFEVRRDVVNNVPKLVVTKNDLGTLATSAQVSVPRGLLLKGGWQLKLKAQDRVLERDGSRLLDRAFNLHEMIELQEERALDAEAVATASEAARKKAVDFLLRNGLAGPPNVVVLRALLAAGASPDEPLVAAALKALAAAPPPEGNYPLALATQLLAGAGRPEAKKLGELLLSRRDARSGVWTLGGRADASNAHATAAVVAALAAVDGLPVPDEVWAAAMEAFTSTSTDDGAEMELDLVFPEGAAPILPDPKKAVPATWPSESARRGGGARKGSGFTILAGIETCLAAASKLKLEERQKQALDVALRRAFAWLQSRWSLRTVPPAEGSWVLQRHEYLSRLAVVLGRAKLDRIGGCDWRVEGATLLLREQGDDGAWASGTDQAISKTAHALLFLSSAKR